MGPHFRLHFPIIGKITPYIIRILAEMSIQQQLCPTMLRTMFMFIGAVTLQPEEQ